VGAAGREQAGAAALSGGRCLVPAADRRELQPGSRLADAAGTGATGLCCEEETAAGRSQGGGAARIQARAAEHERRSGAGGEEGEKKKKWKEVSLEREETRVVKDSTRSRGVEEGGGNWRRRLAGCAAVSRSLPCGPIYAAKVVW